MGPLNVAHLAVGEGDAGPVLVHDIINGQRPVRTVAVQNDTAVVWQLAELRPVLQAVIDFRRGQCAGNQQDQCKDQCDNTLFHGCNPFRTVQMPFGSRSRNGHMNNF